MGDGFQGRWQRQPADDIFIAKITEVGSQVGSTSPGNGYVPHSWIEMRLDAASRSYVTDEIGRTGTATMQPGFFPDGSAGKLGDLVFMRIRGWVNLDWASPPLSDKTKTFNGPIYDILGVASSHPSGTDDDCKTKIVKRWGKVFKQGPNELQRFTIEDCCCNVLYSGCEYIVDDTCDSQSSIGGGCWCPGYPTAPNYQLFTITVVDAIYGTCSDFSGNWCLYCCGEGDTSGNAGCNYHQVKTWPAGPLCLGPEFLANCFLSIFNDGSAALIFIGGSIYCPFLLGPPAFAVYYADAGTWVCDGVNTMAKVSEAGWCSFPSSINVTASNTASSCAGSVPPVSGGGTNDCAACGAHSFTLRTDLADPIPVGMNNGTCTGCSNVEALVLTKTANCTYSGSIPPAPGVVCNGGLAIGGVQAVLFDNNATGWELDMTFPGAHVMRFFLSYASWSCNTANDMHLISAAPYPCIPPTGFVRVTKAS